MKHELFNIGITLYELFFNNLPFYNKTDEILYENCVLRNKSLEDVDYDPIEYPKIDEITKKKFFYKDKKLVIEENLILTISNRRNNWIKKLTKDDIFKNQDFYNDKFFYDLLYKLIKESIKNYDDLYNHPFFSQYKY